MKPPYADIRELINYHMTEEYFEFIDTYAEETGVYLDPLDEKTADEIARNWEGHIYCNIIRIWDWLCLEKEN